MGLLQSAVEEKRWELVAHTVVLAAARTLSNGELNGGKKKQKRYIKTQNNRKEK